MLGGASSFLCGCQSPVRDRVCSPVIEVEDPRSNSKLQCKAGGTGVLPLGKEPLQVLPQELSSGTCDSVMLPATCCAHPKRSQLLVLPSGVTSAV